MDSSPSSSEQPRPRQRAPTITIDTSAVYNQHEGPRPDRQTTTYQESRPTSPHNVSSSPSKRANNCNFLAVPRTRSRGNLSQSTIDDDEPASTGNYVPSSQGDTVRGDCLKEVLSDTDALKPDPGTEAAFEVKDNKFAFSPGQLGKLYNPKSLAAFHALGGLDGLEKGLRTDRRAGLSLDEQDLDRIVTFEEPTNARTSDTPSKRFLDKAPTPANPFADRKRVFRNNRVPERAGQYYYDQVPIYGQETKPITRYRRASHCSRPQPSPQTKWAPPPTKMAPKATEEGARRTGIPAGYSFKNWDPAEEPIMLLGSVFDANSLGKWIYDWTMGNATTICSDKTGTHTQNKMTVVSGTVGSTLKFSEEDGVSTDDVSPSEFVPTLNKEVKDLLLQSIAQNTTAFEGDEDGPSPFIGSKTETALLHFARDHLNMGPVSTERSNANVVQIFPFDSAVKCSATVVQLDDDRYRMYVKGASDILLGKCDSIVSDATKGFAEAPLCADDRDALEQVMTTYASRSLRTIGLAYRDFESWPPQESPTQVVFEDILKEMVFLAIVGIQDPQAAKDRNVTSNVCVRMVTGDNVMTAHLRKTADVGFSMGIAGTEVAQEASEIILMDDNFVSIVEVLEWGRAINHAVDRFVKGLLWSGLAAKLLAIIPAFTASTLPSPLPFVLQLLGVNLIIDTLAALGSRSTLTHFIGCVKPIRRNSPTPTRRRHNPFLSGISSLIAFSLFIPSTAARSTEITADATWRQRALDVLSNLIVSCAFLLAPTMILLITGFVILFLLWIQAEGTLALFMLGMAFVFATIRPAPESSGGNDDTYIRLAIGMAYILFMLAYCRLVVLRNRYGKGFCTIAVILGALATITGMAIPAVREYWVALTNLNPIFALSLAIPSSFFLGDLSVYIIIAVNNHHKDDDDDPSTPSRLEANTPTTRPLSPEERAHRLSNIRIRGTRNPYILRRGGMGNAPGSF